MNSAPEKITLKIDGKSVTVPKGTNLIEAAKSVGIEIPHYCYHPHLSVPGNCRMCQVEIVGQNKLAIGCNTPVSEGMDVKTQATSARTKEAQESTLEFILINHPLDCTVCDQAGHCKLQDYHYEYNAQPSRFLEQKEHKVKAEPLGPTVILDGERCIMCTRCIRFCEEVTETRELGMLNRGDRSVIAIHPGRELNNPLSGSVVDLCPVGALTHRNWRFNSRIWFTKETDSICPGCSTGCNVKVAVRDGEVVNVKARMNSSVNKEWLCDEGRYGFGRFLPTERVIATRIGSTPVSLEEALSKVKAISSMKVGVFLAPDLLTEEYWLIKHLVSRHIKGAELAVAYRERKLTKVEAVLVSPDYAPNFRAAQYVGLVGDNIEQSYEALLKKLEAGELEAVILIGDRSIVEQDQTSQCLAALSKAKLSMALLSDARSKLNGVTQVVVPGRSILEKSGTLINRKGRLQYSDRIIDFPSSSEPAWRVVNQLARMFGAPIVNVTSERELTQQFLSNDGRLNGVTIAEIKKGGIDLASLTGSASGRENVQQGAQV